MFKKAFLMALLERVLRGGVAGVSAGWLAGDVVFNTFNVNNWADVGALFLGGAVSAFVLSLVGGATSGDNPPSPAIASPERLKDTTWGT